ncbi:WhiB family transcriptional regulator [Rhodococcus qingshengii]|uniref:WhiB family transcriptional regulator n=1 Tax=Rhodococcus qingshengii TaxID=334542 RepID=UPI0010A6A417|nr:WhiB family transcriptional regulator [Rhodococcus qingshengii]
MSALNIRLPAAISDSWDWQLAAACRYTNPAVFFHPDNERGEPRVDRVRAAKRICRRCPVLPQCRDYALNAPERHGVWGGFTEEERKMFHTLRGSEPHGTEQRS